MVVGACVMFFIFYFLFFLVVRVRCWWWCGWYLIFLFLVGDVGVVRWVDFSFRVLSDPFDVPRHTYIGIVVPGRVGGCFFYFLFFYFLFFIFVFGFLFFIFYFLFWGESGGVLKLFFFIFIFFLVSCCALCCGLGWVLDFLWWVLKSGGEVRCSDDSFGIHRV